MQSINRSVAIIRPKRTFIKWANWCSPDGREFRSEYFLKEYSTVVLMPKYFIVREARKYINEHWEDIFKEELQYWNSNEIWWPKDRSIKMFRQWFRVEFHSKVIDPVS